MTTTDTPRTDAETYVWQNGGENPFVHRDFARQLERELAASKAEVERLRELLSLEKNGHEGTKKICDKILVGITPSVFSEDDSPKQQARGRGREASGIAPRPREVFGNFAVLFSSRNRDCGNRRLDAERGLPI